MQNTKILVLVVSILYLLAVYAVYATNQHIAEYFIMPIASIVTIFYFFCVKKKSKHVALFLLFFAISDVMDIWSFGLSQHWVYYIGNLLYIAAYILIIFCVLYKISFRYIYKKHKISTFVLLSLSVYIVYVLMQVVTSAKGAELSTWDCILEILYFSSAQGLLIATLLKFFFYDSKKTFLIFIAALCIMMSEVLYSAHLYISNENFLLLFTTFLNTLALMLMYIQSDIEEEGPIQAFY